MALNILYFLCPILYKRDMLPPYLVEYLTLNPLFTQIEFFQGIFYHGVLPDIGQFGVNCCASFLILALGVYVFRKSEDKFLYFV